METNLHIDKIKQLRKRRKDTSWNKYMLKEKDSSELLWSNNIDTLDKLKISLKELNKIDSVEIINRTTGKLNKKKITHVNLLILKLFGFLTSSKDITLIYSNIFINDSELKLSLEIESKEIKMKERHLADVKTLIYKCLSGHMEWNPTVFRSNKSESRHKIIFQVSLLKEEFKLSTKLIGHA